MYADLSLDHKVLKDIVEKTSKARRTTGTGRLHQSAHSISLRRACRVLGIGDSVYRYQPDPARDDAVIAGLQQAVAQYPAYGFSLLFKILRRWGHRWNHKRVHRIYCRLNLNKRRRGKKRLPNRAPVSLKYPRLSMVAGRWILCAKACFAAVGFGHSISLMTLVVKP